MNDKDGCVVCGCSQEVNEDGERICFCDTCFPNGDCVYDNTEKESNTPDDKNENSEYIDHQNLNPFESSEECDDTFGSNYDYYNNASL